MEVEWLVHNGRTWFGVVSRVEGWQVLYQTLDRHVRAQGGYYTTRADAETAAYRYASP